MGNILRVGTRPSPLAMKQVEEVKSMLSHVRFKAFTIWTRGDVDRITPLSETEGSDFFTREIEDALLTGRIDAALHSAKDLEEAMPAALMIAAMTASISPYDCLVSRGKETLDSLSSGAVVGTSSRKRKADILRHRPDLTIKDLRGNIDERLKQLDKGDFDAIIIAHAALIRLGYEKRIAEIITQDIVRPHALQGRLALQIRRDRRELFELFRGIDAG